MTMCSYCLVYLITAIVFCIGVESINMQEDSKVLEELRRVSLIQPCNNPRCVGFSLLRDGLTEIGECSRFVLIE